MAQGDFPIKYGPKTLEHAYLRIFRLTTSRSTKFIPKADLNDNVHISILNFFLKSFSQYLKKKSKNGFPIVFLNCNFEVALGF